MPSAARGCRRGPGWGGAWPGPGRRSGPPRPVGSAGGRRAAGRRGRRSVAVSATGWPGVAWSSQDPGRGRRSRSKTKVKMIREKDLRRSFRSRVARRVEPRLGVAAGEAPRWGSVRCGHLQRPRMARMARMTDRRGRPAFHPCSPCHPWWVFSASWAAKPFENRSQGIPSDGLAAQLSKQGRATSGATPRPGWGGHGHRPPAAAWMSSTAFLGYGGGLGVPTGWSAIRAFRWAMAASSWASLPR
ncbi:hypothetical protein OJF2_37410 [Aquisphaera giovannonii]|uniref:Uncharacterized protein n=1 Tax=Aquisphaera giovannonii TaxID=406548 RepID=A0A5B9W4Q0_9BACT|nr:hypothetical protein OJF2_37410 [Aquisphaera giovannonii]